MRNISATVKVLFFADYNFRGSCFTDVFAGIVSMCFFF